MKGEGWWIKADPCRQLSFVILCSEDPLLDPPNHLPGRFFPPPPAQCDSGGRSHFGAARHSGSTSIRGSGVVLQSSHK